MAVIVAVQDVSLVGLDPAYVAADAGLAQTFENRDERVMFEVVNGGGGAVLVTISATRACNHGFTHDISESVPAGQNRVFGPFDKERFNTSAGIVDVAYDQVTTVTVAALRLPKAP